MLESWWIGILFFASFAAGFVDAIAGGGGLITLPALLFSGLPPHLALGVNKMQSTFGTLMAVFNYSHKGLIQWNELRSVLFFTFLSSCIGTLALMVFDQGLLQLIIPWLLIGIAIYMIWHPHVGKTSDAPRCSSRWFAVSAGMGLGFYDGFFGPGTGSFWTLAWMRIMGLELTKATAHTKAVNLASNLGSLIIFLWFGYSQFLVASVMVLGQVLGGLLGSATAIKHGAPLIRKFLIIVTLMLGIKITFDVWFKL